MVDEGEGFRTLKVMTAKIREAVKRIRASCMCPLTIIQAEITKLKGALGESRRQVAAQDLELSLLRSMAAAESGRADDALARLAASEQLCHGLTASLAESQARIEELLQDREEEEQEGGGGGGENGSRDDDNAAAVLLRMQAQVVLLQDENAQLRNNTAPELPTWPHDNAPQWGKQQQQQQQPVADALPCVTPADPTDSCAYADDGEEGVIIPNPTGELSPAEELLFGSMPQEVIGHYTGERQ